jgi:muconolactone delta-isomerase
MQFLTLSRRRTEQFTDEQFAARVAQELARARELYAEGFFRQLWHRADVPGGCLLIEADSEAQVREKLDTLPLVQAGMLELSIIPLKPYAGFGPAAQPAGAAGDQ